MPASPLERPPMSQPAPTAPVPATRSGFVTVLGAVSLGLAAIGLFSGLVQVLVLWIAPDDLVAQLLAGLDGGLADMPELPSMLAWSLTHRIGLSVAGTLLTALFLAVSWGLLLRRNWGRLGFIGFLLLGVPVNLAGLLLMWQMQQWILALNTGLNDPALDAHMRGIGMATMGLATVCTLVLAALHFWLIHRLRARAVRAEFGLDPNQ